MKKLIIPLSIVEVLFVAFTIPFYFSENDGLIIILSIVDVLLTTAYVLFLIFGGKSKNNNAIRTDYEYQENAGDIAYEDDLSPEQIEMINQMSSKNRNTYWHIILIMILS